MHFSESEAMKSPSDDDTAGLMDVLFNDGWGFLDNRLNLEIIFFAATIPCQTDGVMLI